MFQLCLSRADLSQAACAELREKLQDAKKQLHSQEDMIRWLNNQVSHCNVPASPKPIRMSSY